MARIPIYDKLTNRTYNVNISLEKSYRSTSGTTTVEEDVYMLLTTDIRRQDGTAFDRELIRDLEDVPDDGGTASAPNFQSLFNRWVIWIKEEASLGVPSEESSSSSEESSSSSEESSSSSGV